MRRLFHPVAVVLFVGLVFAGCQTSATRTSAKSEKTAKTNALTPFDLESGVLTVGYAPDYPPYEYTDKTGSPAGIAVDVITEVARRMDMETRLQALSRDEALQALNEGQIDVIAWMPYSPERGREFVLSVGWAQTTSSVFVRKTSKYNEISDVVPKVMVAPTGNIEYDALRRKGVTQLIGTQSIEEALMKTVTGTADGAGCNREVARAVMNRHVGWETALRELDPPLAVTTLTAASRKGNEILMYHISRTLLEMKRDGTLARLTGTGDGGSQ